MAQPTEVPEVPDPRSVEVDWSAAELYEPKPEYRRDFASKVYEVARIPGFDGYRIRAQGRRQHKGEVHTGQQVEQMLQKLQKLPGARTEKVPLDGYFESHEAMQARFTTALSNKRETTQQDRDRLGQVERAVVNLAAIIDFSIEDGRDKSLALTALEEVLWRTNRHIYRDGVKQ